MTVENFIKTENAVVEHEDCTFGTAVANRSATDFGQIRDTTAGLTDGAPPPSNAVWPRNIAYNPSGSVVALESEIPYTGITDRQLAPVYPWYFLIETGAVDRVAGSFPMQIGGKAASGNTTRWGFAQKLDKGISEGWQGSPVTFSFKIEASSSVDIGFAILSTTSVAEQQELVNNWSSTTYTPGNFFASLSAFTVDAVGFGTADTTPTTMEITANAVTQSRFIIFVWSVDQIGDTVTLHIGEVQVELGSVRTPFAAPPRGFDMLHSATGSATNWQYPTPSVPLSEDRGGTGVGSHGFFNVHKNGTDQTGIADFTFTLVTWSTEAADDDSLFDLSNEWIIPNAGTWLFEAKAFFTSANMEDQGRYSMAIYKDSGSGFAQDAFIGDVRASGTAGHFIEGMALINADGDDKYALYVRGDGAGGGALTLSGGATLTYWKGIRLFA